MAVHTEIRTVVESSSWCWTGDSTVLSAGFENVGRGASEAIEIPRSVACGARLITLETRVLHEVESRFAGDTRIVSETITRSTICMARSAIVGEWAIVNFVCLAVSFAESSGNGRIVCCECVGNESEPRKTRCAVEVRGACTKSTHLVAHITIIPTVVHV